MCSSQWCTLSQPDYALLLNRTAIVLLAGAATLYSVLWLPQHFGGLSLASWYVILVAMAGLTSAIVVWRLGTFDRAVATGLGLVAGFVSLFWPALELSFQHIDGGGMSRYQNTVFLASVSLSGCALAGGVVTLTRPELAFRLFATAAIGTVVVGLVAPSSPPSARVELTLGLPLLIAAAAAGWFAKRQAA
jgi:hypothetical protein